MTNFDDAAHLAFSYTLDFMGEDALWQSSLGEVVSGRILFRYPTQPYTIGEADTYEYKVNTPTAEFYKDTFLGLKEMVDEQNFEYMSIRGKRYFIKEIETKFDGDTYVAHLELFKD